MKLSKTGQAVIIDLGEGKDIQPRNKHDVAARLVRWALVKDYGMNFPYRSPEFKSMEVAGSKAVITFDCFGSSLRPFDQEQVTGFAECGADKVWHWAKGVVQGKDKVEVSCDQVPLPSPSDMPGPTTRSATSSATTDFRLHHSGLTISK
jgi:sialate O-acetylesterase